MKQLAFTRPGLTSVADRSGKLLPREKLALSGPDSLEDHDLLAVILGKGNRHETVFALAKRLLSDFDREGLVHLKNVKQLQEHFQLSFVQACQLIATFEIGRRFFSKSLPAVVLRTTDQVYEFVGSMRYLKREYVRGLYLNSRYRLIHDEMITIGSLDSNVVHPREIFKPAIEYSAYALILVHNHPSGDHTPSQEDLEITKKLAKVGKLLQIPLLDHLVIGEKAYTSLNKLSSLN